MPGATENHAIRLLGEVAVAGAVGFATLWLARRFLFHCDTSLSSACPPPSAILRNHPRDDRPQGLEDGGAMAGEGLTSSSSEGLTSTQSIKAASTNAGAAHVEAGISQAGPPSSVFGADLNKCCGQGLQVVSGDSPPVGAAAVLPPAPPPPSIPAPSSPKNVVHHHQHQQQQQQQHADDGLSSSFSSDVANESSSSSSASSVGLQHSQEFLEGSWVGPKAPEGSGGGGGGGDSSDEEDDEEETEFVRAPLDQSIAFPGGSDTVDISWKEQEKQ